MVWIIKPIIGNYSICSEVCDVGGVSCSGKCPTDFGCIAFTPTDCNVKDCTGGSMYVCQGTVTCLGLTCVLGGYICTEARCTQFYGQCVNTTGMI